MLDETVRFVKETMRDLEATKSGVSTAQKSYGTLQEDIRLAKGRLSYKKSTRHAEVYARKILRAFKDENYTRVILLKEIDDALIRAGREFQQNENLYKFYLYQAAEDPNIYKLIPLGSGWGIRISPQIVFEETAGNLEDYARGIEAYRASLGTKVDEGGTTDRGLRATRWWRENVYGSDKYESTVEGRIGISGRVAPFWQLIAKGSTALPSDRPDSSYNPFPAAGVDFVTNAEDIIRREFITRFGEERKIWQEETETFEREIKSAERLLSSLEEDLDSLKTELSKNTATLRKFGEKAQFISEKKLAEAARRLRAGQEFETDRIELTAPGSPFRVRPSVRRLEGLLEY